MDVSANHKFKKILNAWNSGKPDELIKLCTDLIVYQHSGSEYLVIRGKEGFRTYLTGLFTYLFDTFYTLRPKMPIFIGSTETCKYYVVII